MPVPYLTTPEFNTGQTAWQNAVNDNITPISQAFEMSGDALMGSLSFPLDTIKAVLSAVGARHLRLDFILSEPAQSGNFTAVLYATDKQGKPLTAYYGPAVPKPLLHQLADSPIPATLANLWLSNWASPSLNISKQMFLTKTEGGDTTPLLGFRLGVKEVVDALFVAGESTSMTLLFGLHSFFGPDATGSPTQQFGVILTPSNPAVGAVAALYYDLLMPCPPY